MGSIHPPIDHENRKMIKKMNSRPFIGPGPLLLNANDKIMANTTAINIELTNPVYINFGFKGL